MKSRAPFIITGFTLIIACFSLFITGTSSYFLNELIFTGLGKKMTVENHYFELIHLDGFESIKISDSNIIVREGIILENGSRVELNNCTLTIDVHFDKLAQLELYDNSSLILNNCTLRPMNDSLQSLKLSDIAVFSATNVTAPGITCESYGENRISMYNTTIPLIISQDSRPNVFIKSSHIQFINRHLPAGEYVIYGPENEYIQHYSSELNGKMVIQDSTVETFSFTLSSNTSLKSIGSGSLSLTFVLSGSGLEFTVEGLQAGSQYREREIELGSNLIYLNDTYLKESAAILQNSAHVLFQNSALTYLETNDDSFAELDESSLITARLYDQSALAIYDSETDAHITVCDESSLFLENSSIFEYSFCNRRKDFYILQDGVRK